MAFCDYCGREHNVGFISTRLAGTDGVSLEVDKWVTVLEKLGFTSYFFAGELDTPPEVSFLVDKAHFKHPAIKDIYLNSFGVRYRKRFITTEIQDIKREIKDNLYKFVEKFKIDLLVPQNSLTIPLNIPLGIAITEFIAEIGINTIAHHHDFYWERDRFKTNGVWDYLNMAFPPHLPSIQHVVINSSADNQLSLRTGISPTLIPNVMDFENPPPPPDDYTSDVRHALGIEDDTLFILQPTRIVQRKGIEHAIELVHRIGMKAKLVISHASGDEGYDYECRVKDYSELLKVDTLFVSDIIGEERGVTKDGQKIYTLQDVYPHADLVTYPSTVEGFGNAFLEAIYFHKPIVVNTYAIYTMDIKPKGFKVIELDGYVTYESIEKTKKVLTDADYRRKMVDTNYEIARTYYSYKTLQQKLKNLLMDCMGCPEIANRHNGDNSQ
ncbi:MAG: glycosyltransferase family 4 protein [Desulfobacterales bacterium]|nr:glycosyltransferase family 4 protein [Desulfobacterales bacterium]